MTPRGAIDLMAASTLSLIDAVPVSTTSTPSLPDDTVMLPPAPTSIDTRPRTGRMCTCPSFAAGSAGFHAHAGRAGDCAVCVWTIGASANNSIAAAASRICHLLSATFCRLLPAACSLSTLRRGAFLHIRPRERLQFLDVLGIHRLGTAETRLVRRPEFVVLIPILRRQQVLAREIVRHRAVLDDALGGFF